MHCDFKALAKEGIRTLHPYQPGKPIEELERELGLTNIVKLASNENPLGLSPKAKRVIEAQLDNLTRYPDGGHFELRQSLAKKLSVSPSQLVFGNGSNDVLDLIGHCFLDDCVSAIYSEHAFIVYPLMVQSQGAEAISVPAKDFGHDLDAMLAAIKANTRVVFVANPNNPTGTFIPFGEIKAFLQKVPPDVLVVLDEAYFEYIEAAPEENCLQLLDTFQNLIITRTFSKAYGLAGLRVGYSVASEAVSQILQAARAPFNVNTLAQVAACAVLGDQDYLDASLLCNAQGLQQLAAGLERLSFDFIPSKGNFITFDTKQEAGLVYQALLEEGVIVRPVGVYGLPQHLRVSVGLEAENARFLAALEKVTEK